MSNTPGAILPHLVAAENTNDQLIDFLRARGFPFTSLSSKDESYRVALVKVVELLQNIESRPSGSLLVKGDAPVNLPKDAYMATTSVHCVPADVHQMHNWPNPADMVSDIKRIDQGMVCRISSEQIEAYCSTGFEGADAHKKSTEGYRGC